MRGWIGWRALARVTHRCCSHADAIRVQRTGGRARRPRRQHGHIIWLATLLGSTRKTAPRVRPIRPAMRQRGLFLRLPVAFWLDFGLSRLRSWEVATREDVETIEQPIVHVRVQQRQCPVPCRCTFAQRSPDICAT